jgi:hypothetical protein
MRILQLNVMILRNERKFPLLLRSVVKGQDHSFFKDLTGGFCTVGGTLVCYYPVTVSEQILSHMNIRISLPIKEHN